MTSHYRSVLLISAHSQNWYSCWGRRFLLRKEILQVAAESFPSWKNSFSSQELIAYFLTQEAVYLLLHFKFLRVYINEQPPIDAHTAAYYKFPGQIWYQRGRFCYLDKKNQEVSIVLRCYKRPCFCYIYTTAITCTSWLDLHWYDSAWQKTLLTSSCTVNPHLSEPHLSKKSLSCVRFPSPKMFLWMLLDWGILLMKFCFSESR